MAKKRLVFFFVLVGAAFLLCADTFALGSPEKAKEAITSGAVVIDVRSESEFASGHLEGAINIPHTEILDRLPEIKSDKAKPIVVYCAIGGRAALAEKALRDNGFKNVINGGGYDSLKK